MLSIKDVSQLLSEVCDPEIPVINVLEMGIVSEVAFREDCFEIFITPTYSGCPAIDQIREDIEQKLKENEITDFRLITRLNPPWTTDMMWISAKEKLKEFGIAPPCSLHEIREKGEQTPNCPLCDSSKTELISEFSSTACKSLYRCTDCLEPFDYFKPH